MKRIVVFCCAALTASLAMAQPPQDYSHRNDSNHENLHRDDSHRGDQGRGHQAYQTQHHWARGQRIPTQYRSSRYVVTDYNRYHLRRPPRGYHWVRDDNGNFLMVAITTGIITSLLLNSQ